MNALVINMRTFHYLIHGGFSLEDFSGSVCLSGMRPRITPAIPNQLLCEPCQNTQTSLSPGGPRGPARGPLSCPALKVTWQLTFDPVAWPRPDFSVNIFSLNILKVSTFLWCCWTHDANRGSNYQSEKIRGQSKINKI